MSEGGVVSTRPGVRPWHVALIIVVTAALRVALIAWLPDSDTDAYGHFDVARSLARSPGDLSVHWVWLPGWHFVLALLIKLHAGFVGARLFNALVAAAGPAVLYLSLRRNSARVATIAALAWALAPLTNVMATSAQSETLFALLLVVGCQALGRRQGVLAGVCLAAACLLRYEAWAAVVALSLGLASRCDRRERRATAIAIGLPALAVVGWCAVRAGFDGRWFAFVGETTRFVGGVDRGKGAFGLLLYSAVLPVKVFGPACILVAAGCRRAARRVPELARASLGVLVFITLAAVLGASFGLDRHFASLVPFACIAIGHGAHEVSGRMTRLGLGAMPVVLAAHLAWLVVTTQRRWGPQSAAAAWVDEYARDNRMPIVCTSLSLQVLTGLGEERFVREPPQSAPSLVFGFETGLGRLAEEGTLVARWPQRSPEGDPVVVRLIAAGDGSPVRRARSSVASKSASGTN